MTGNVQRHLMRALGGTPGQPGRRAPDPTSDRPLAVLIVVGLVLAMAAGTQYFAWRAHFDDSLGSPLIVLGADAILGFRVAGVLTAGGALVALTRRRSLRLAGLLLLVSLHAGLGSGGRHHAPSTGFIRMRKTNTHCGGEARL